MILVKGIFGGIVALIVMWCIILAVHTWGMRMVARQQGITGLTAIAGGWNYLIHMPLVVVLLTTAFGIGIYVVAR